MTFPHEQPPERLLTRADASAGAAVAALAASELLLFAAGHHRQAGQVLGAHAAQLDGTAGVRFATWAPAAEAVSVVGDFNGWRPDAHPMHRAEEAGVWQRFVPGLAAGAHYRLALRTPGGAWVERADPCAGELAAPGSGVALVVDKQPYPWQDEAWIGARRTRDWLREPVTIYEIEPGTWGREADGRPLGYRALAERLAPRIVDLGFTHVELSGVAASQAGDRVVMETPFSPSRRYGTPADFRYFVDRCHQRGIGVLVDWTAVYVGPALARFDGSTLFEQAPLGEDSARAVPIFELGRGGVRSLLVSSALFWLREMHVDGLRLPNLAAALYLDYARGEGGWIPNKYGGNESLEAISFLRDLTALVQAEVPGAMLIAEESTGWPQLTRPPWVGGLGFTLRWSSGWMHDTLEYFAKDPVYRHYHHDMLTLSPLHAFRESYVLPLSREEVAGPPGPLLQRMPGDPWQRVANIRLLYTYLWTFPGKKLLFMGGDPGVPGIGNPRPAGVEGAPPSLAIQGLRALVRDLNKLYRDSASLHRQELSHRGFEWIDRHDAPQSIIAYLRRDGDQVVVVALNFTPVPRHAYRIGVPLPGCYREVLNSDSAYYGGSNLGNMGDLRAEPVAWMGRPYSVSIVLPPLAGVVLKPAGEEAGQP